MADKVDRPTEHEVELMRRGEDIFAVELRCSESGLFRSGVVMVAPLGVVGSRGSVVTFGVSRVEITVIG